MAPLRPALVLLLLLLHPATADEGFVGLLRSVCGAPPAEGRVVQAVQCPAPPCSTARGGVMLALPVLLSLPAAAQLRMMGYLYDRQGHGRGLLDLWPQDYASVRLRGGTCDGDVHSDSAVREGEWVHVAVLVRESSVHVTVTNVTQEARLALTYHHRHHLPATLRVDSAQCGYSALAAAATTTITTQNATSTQAVVVATSTLVGVSVVVSVGVLVLVCWGRLEAEALLGAVQA